MEPARAVIPVSRDVRIAPSLLGPGEAVTTRVEMERPRIRDCVVTILILFRRKRWA